MVLTFEISKYLFYNKITLIKMLALLFTLIYKLKIIDKNY